MYYMIVRHYYFLNGTSTTEIYTYCHTLSLHDALPIARRSSSAGCTRSSPGAASTPASSPPGGAGCGSDERGRQAAQPRLRLRDPHDPRGHAAGAGDRRAPDADLPEHLLCVPRRRPRGIAVHPAALRLHLLAPHTPDGGDAGGAPPPPGRRPKE